LPRIVSHVFNAGTGFEKVGFNISAALEGTDGDADNVNAFYRLIPFGGNYAYFHGKLPVWYEIAQFMKYFFSFVLGDFPAGVKWVAYLRNRQDRLNTYVCSRRMRCRMSGGYRAAAVLF
jgi:hypothetical protein